MRNILVTGGSGYLGRTFIRRVLSDCDDVIIHNLDITPLDFDNRRLVNHVLDIRSSKLYHLLSTYEIDTVVHLVAIIGGKGMSKEKVDEIEITGLQNVLNTCIKVGVAQFVFASSGSVYGYHSKLPNLIDESYPLFENHVIQYGKNKVKAEKLIANYKNAYGLNTTVLRICSILGESSSNLVCKWFKRKRIFGIKGFVTPFSFVWDQDLAHLLKECLERRIFGTFNVSGNGYITLREIAEIQSKRYIELGDQFLGRTLEILNRISPLEYRREHLDFLKYRPLLNTQKYESAFHYKLAKNSKETFILYINS